MNALLLTWLGREQELHHSAADVAMATAEKFDHGSVPAGDEPKTQHSRTSRKQPHLPNGAWLIGIVWGLLLLRANCNWFFFSRIEKMYILSLVSWQMKVQDKYVCLGHAWAVSCTFYRFTFQSVHRVFWGPVWNLRTRLWNDLAYHSFSFSTLNRCRWHKK